MNQASDYPVHKWAGRQMNQASDEPGVRLSGSHGKWTGRQTIRFTDEPGVRLSGSHAASVEMQHE